MLPSTKKHHRLKEREKERKIVCERERERLFLHFAKVQVHVGETPCISGSCYCPKVETKVGVSLCLFYSNVKSFIGLCPTFVFVFHSLLFLPRLTWPSNVNFQILLIVQCFIIQVGC